MRWFVASMNDCLFIIDQPPRPSTDDCGASKPNVIAKLDYPDADNHAALLAAAPALREGCQKARAYLACYADPTSDSIIRCLDAAIADAQGKAAKPAGFSIEATEVKCGELVPGDLFSTLGPEYWGRKTDYDASSIGEKVYIRTENPTPAGRGDDPIFRITITK